MALREKFPVRGTGAFRRPDLWQGFLLSDDERRRLNNLLGSALLDSQVCERLVFQRDSALMSAYGLSLETQEWLRGIEASSLAEFAQAIVIDG